MNILDRILELWLPTLWSRTIAVSSILLGVLAIRLPELLQDFGLETEPQSTLMFRSVTPLTIWLVGSLIVLILVSRTLTQQKQNNALLETQTENQKIALENLQTEVQARDAEINHLRQENKSLNDLLNTQPPDKWDARTS
jgi:cell division protein FtsB